MVSGNRPARLRLQPEADVERGLLPRLSDSHPRSVRGDPHAVGLGGPAGFPRFCCWRRSCSCSPTCGSAFPTAPTGLPMFVLLALGLFPPTLFMRMAYSESLFLFLTVLAMYGMERNWRLWGIAAVVGLATATRFTGVALLLPLAMHVWPGSAQRGTRWRRLPH